MNTRELLALLAEYNAYANNLVLNVVEQVGPAALEGTPSPSRSTPFKLLRHYLVAEAFFLASASGQPFALPAVRGAADLRPLAEHTAAGLRAWLANCGEEDLQRELTVELNQRTFHLPAWQLLLQGVFHSTTHRAELATVLSQAGYPLPDLDLIVHLLAQTGQRWTE